MHEHYLIFICITFCYIYAVLNPELTMNADVSIALI